MLVNIRNLGWVHANTVQAVYTVETSDGKFWPTVITFESDTGTGITDLPLDELPLSEKVCGSVAMKVNEGLRQEAANGG